MDEKETIKILKETKVTLGKHISQWGDAELTVNPLLDDALSQAITLIETIGECADSSKKAMKETIDTFDSEIFTLSKYLEDKEMGVSHRERFRKMRKALLQTISLIQIILECRDVPEKKEIGDYSHGPRGMVQISEGKGFNSCHDLFLPIHVRDRARIKELEEQVCRIEKAHLEVSYEVIAKDKKLEELKTSKPSKEEIDSIMKQHFGLLVNRMPRELCAQAIIDAQKKKEERDDNKRV